MKRFLFLILLLIGCGGKSIRPMGTAEIEFSRGEAYFEKGDFKHAVQSFEFLIFNFPGSNLVDDAQLYIAKSQLAMKHYEQASLEAQFLIENFPRSELVEEAYIIRVRALFAALPPYRRDQSRTMETIKILEQFIENYPSSKFLDEAREILYKCRSRISQKLLKNGRFYKRRGDLDASVIYFNMILNRYPETVAAREAMYCLAEILEHKLRIEEARRHYSVLADSTDEWGMKAKKRLEEIGK
ncbi:MAG TPA: outer membrane protein assembly factor BamD [bacterium (Candidatus Stahlbacteria)]|nr:outer membrane protein assembly factor BamD [Candidatus Stahlbacteria bacterium]